MKTKKIILVLLFLGIAGAFVAYKLYNKPHIDVVNSESDIVIKAMSLVDDFSSDENAANTKYLDKIIKVSGTIATKEQENNTIIIGLKGNDFGNIMCNFSKENTPKLNNLKQGETITVKGICTGFLLDVVLVDCVLVQ